MIRGIRVAWEETLPYLRALVGESVEDVMFDRKALIGDAELNISQLIKSIME
ncbi:MAG: hypothetical protein QXW32_06520 [Nitrososphaerales archaeon]